MENCGNVALAAVVHRDHDVRVLADVCPRRRAAEASGPRAERRPGRTVGNREAQPIVVCIPGARFEGVVLVDGDRAGRRAGDLRRLIPRRRTTPPGVDAERADRALVAPSVTLIVISSVSPTSVSGGMPLSVPVSVLNSAHLGGFSMENSMKSPSASLASGVNSYNTPASALGAGVPEISGGEFTAVGWSVGCSVSSFSSSRQPARETATNSTSACRASQDAKPNAFFIAPTFRSVHEMSAHTSLSQGSRAAADDRKICGMTAGVARPHAPRSDRQPRYPALMRSDRRLCVPVFRRVCP